MNKDDIDTMHRKLLRNMRHYSNVEDSVWISIRDRGIHAGKHTYPNIRSLTTNEKCIMRYMERYFQ